MSPPLAYFITWTVAGTRLHGDERGSVNRESNLVGHPRMAPNRALEEQERADLRHEPLLLTQAMRSCVDGTVRAHCEFRRWTLLALNVRTNHVHVVVRAPETPETVMGQFKAWSSRRLREAGLIVPELKLWTRHGSTIWLNQQEEVDARIDYVNRLQDLPGRFEML